MVDLKNFKEISMSEKKKRKEKKSVCLEQSILKRDKVRMRNEDEGWGQVQEVIARLWLLL